MPTDAADLGGVETMPHYVLIETRSVWESQEVAGFLETAATLARSGLVVDLFLVQNGVLMAHRHAVHQLAPLTAMPQQVTIWVDQFSLHSRAIEEAHVAAGIQLASMERLVILLTQPDCKPIWH
jgi:predicted peroxiredoxin